jgi:hypothetical protein
MCGGNDRTVVVDDHRAAGGDTAPMVADAAAQPLERATSGGVDQPTASHRPHDRRVAVE